MKKNEVRVLDVRDDNEREEKRIPGSLHTYVGDLEEKIPPLPKEDNWWFIAVSAIEPVSPQASSSAAGSLMFLTCSAASRRGRLSISRSTRPISGMSRTMETKTS